MRPVQFPETSTRSFLLMATDGRSVGHMLHPAQLRGLARQTFPMPAGSGLQTKGTWRNLTALDAPEHEGLPLMREAHSLTLVKSGLFAGGASYADIAFCARAERLGLASTHVVTGGIDAQMRTYIDHAGLSYEIDPRLDRGNTGEKVSALTALSAREASRKRAVVLSQPFCSGRPMAVAAATVGSKIPLILRHHNPFVEFESLYSEVNQGVSVPNQAALEARCRTLNPKIEVIEMNPTIIGSAELPADAAARQDMRIALRHALGVESSDVLVLQATRINLQKGADVSLELCGKIQRLLDRSSPVRKIRLLYAGHLDDPGVRAHLLRVCVRQGLLPNQIVFLDGDLTGLPARTFLDVAVACDLAVAPSRRDTFGMTIAEACLAMAPYVTTRWGDEVESDNYGLVYESRGIDGWLVKANLPTSACSANDAALDEVAEEFVDSLRHSNTSARMDNSDRQWANRAIAEDDFISGYTATLLRIMRSRSVR